MDKQKIELTAQLMAIEHLVTRLYALHYQSKGYSLELIRSMHKLQLERARQETFPQVDPALSDHAAGEFETELERLFHAIEWRLEGLKAQ